MERADEAMIGICRACLSLGREKEYCNEVNIHKADTKYIFIGTESNHSLPLSVTHSRTNYCSLSREP